MASGMMSTIGVPDELFDQIYGDAKELLAILRGRGYSPSQGIATFCAAIVLIFEANRQGNKAETSVADMFALSTLCAAQERRRQQ